MNEHAIDLWIRAKEALSTARRDLEVSPDAAASRAYYAAFYAVSALFARSGKTFTRHAAVEAAVHRDLVRTGRWPEELGKDYSELVQLRMTGDYGGGEHVSSAEAQDAVDKAHAIIEAVQRQESAFSEADAHE